MQQEFISWVVSTQRWPQAEVEHVHVTDRETSKGGECLGQQGLCLEQSVVFGPDSAHDCLCCLCKWRWEKEWFDG